MTIANELRIAARSLARSPLLAVSIIASLAVSIGAVTSAFAIVDTVLVRALPFREPDQVVWMTSIRAQRNDAPFSLPEFLDYRAELRTMDLAAYGTWSAALATS